MKVLLVDDHPLILSALCNILEALPGNIQPLPVETPQQAFDLLAQDDEVELVLLDLALGDDVDGFGVLAELRSRHPALPVVVVSGTERLIDVVRLVDMGAMGFVPKRSSNAELTHALSMVTMSGVYIPRVLLDLITRMQGRGDLGDTTITAASAQLAALDDAAAREQAAREGQALPSAGALSVSAAQPAPVQTGPAPPPPPPPTPASLGLTPRQADVLTLLLKGLPNKLIARELNISVETIKDHVAAVLRVLGVTSRTQAVLAVSRLNEQGLVLPSRPHHR